MERRAERGIDMETWGFYVSGVRYGTCRKEGERVFHSPLDVTSGEFLPERELAPEDDRYVVLGKMNVPGGDPPGRRQVYGFLRGDL